MICYTQNNVQNVFLHMCIYYIFAFYNFLHVTVWEQIDLVCALDVIDLIRFDFERKFIMEVNFEC